MADLELEGGFTEVQNVEFRGLSSHYMVNDTIRASFRYDDDDFAASEQDWIGLFEAGTDAADVAVAAVVPRVSVSNPQMHSLCDGGLWRQGTVLFHPSELPTTGGAYRLCYIGRKGSEERVRGRSASFKLCHDVSEYPSMMTEGTDDCELLATLRENSPLPTTMSFEDLGEGLSRRAHSNGSNSFIIVADERESSCGRPNAARQAGGEIKSGGKIEVEATTRERDQNMQEREQCTVVKVEDEGECDVGGKATPDEREQENASNRVQPQNSVDRSPNLQENSGTSAQQANGSLQCVGEVDSSSEQMADVSLTESTVLVESITPTEAWRLKQHNKELRKKIQILSTKLSQAGQNQDRLKSELEMERELNNELRIEKSTLINRLADQEKRVAEVEAENLRVGADQALLLQKIKQLEGNLATLSEHDRRQLQRLQAYETELCVLRSERAVAEGKRVEKLEKQEQAKKTPASKERPHQSSHHHHHTKRKEQESSTAGELKSKQPPVPAAARPKAEASADRKHKDTQPRERKEKQAEFTASQTRNSQGQTAAKPRSKESRTPHSAANTQASAHSRAEPSAAHARPTAGEPSTALSEERIQEITAKLKGSESAYRCPVCKKQLTSRESEYSASLHIEHCLRTNGQQ